MEPYEERRRLAIRLSILQYLITVVFSILAVSFWVLQVVQHAKFEEMEFKVSAIGIELAQRELYVLASALVIVL